VFLLMAAALYGPVCYSGITHPGHSYSMSDSYWVNSGTEPEMIVIHVDPPAGAYWIRMKENSITLNPGQAASIPVTLYIPPGAARGIYEAKLVASSGAEENVLFGVGVGADCTGGSPVVRKKGNSGGIIPLGIVGGLLITVLIGLRIMPRRSNCDHPVHGPRRNKWRSLTRPGRASGTGPFATEATSSGKTQESGKEFARTPRSELFLQTPGRRSRLLIDVGHHR
jgi:hypothetical protein